MHANPDPDIALWLAQRGFGAHAATFAEHDIDLNTLSELTYDHLREMGLPLGVCLRLRKALAAHAAQTVLPGTNGARDIAEALAQVVTERRQVTAMFCDIVGSTRLATDLDPEEMRRHLVSYWTIVESTAASHQGYIAQHLGDGALIYFGFPVARENDAERAILAGLDLLQEIAKTKAGGKTRLQVRIGLATGTVVINQFKGAAGKIETLAIGHSVNFASRLQSLAVPGSLVTDAQTRALVEGLFSFDDMGLIDVDGFAEPVPLSKVTGAMRLRSRFEARPRATTTIFRGRKAALDEMNAHWQDSTGAQGRLVLVMGEPGIGKSRLVQEFMGGAAHAAATTIQLQCAAHSSSTPLFPVIECLSIMAGTVPADPGGHPADRLRSLLAATGEAETLLLGLFQQGPAPASGNPHHRRNVTLHALVEVFASKCTAGPLLFVIEDLHLCDPTTLEFLGRLWTRGRSLPIMILGTARPEFAHDFGGAGGTTTLSLQRLDRGDTDDLVQELFAGRPVAAQLRDLVAVRTDGVPLFVEELLKSLIETGAIALSGPTVRLADAFDGGAIPRRLQSILTARLDRLRSAKRVAQIAACIGRTFSCDLLASATGLPPGKLRVHLHDIAASDLIAPLGADQPAAFSFRHALVRDAAYGSVLFSERQAIHGQIADALLQAPEPVRPEILAHHLTGAQRLVPAIVGWCRAGETAKARSADAEAMLHLNRALKAVEQLPHGTERGEHELTVLLALIASLRAARCFAAADVAALTARAIVLADRARDARRILPLLYNRWVYSFVSSHRDECEPLARDILERSAFDETNLLRMAGLRALAATQFTAGDFRAAAPNFDASIAAYDAVRQAEMIHAVGLDGKVTALGCCALTRWCLGDAALAQSHIRDALATAGAVDHISTAIFAIYHEALLAGVLAQDAHRLRNNGRT